MKYIRYQYSRNLSWEILLWERVRELPVKVIPLCRRMGVRVVKYSDVPTLRSENPDGFFAMIGGKPYIFYNDALPSGRQRFTIAHELGHILLRHDADPLGEGIENEANVFASRLLMPACVLKECHVRDAGDIVQLCDVSRAAAEVRYRRLLELCERDKFYANALEQKVYRRFRKYIKDHRLTREAAPAWRSSRE